jgi:hypothetical protein
MSVRKCIYTSRMKKKSIYGTLGYVDEFSEKYDYRKPNYFYIGNISFKTSHVRKLAESEK